MKITSFTISQILTIRQTLILSALFYTLKKLTKGKVYFKIINYIKYGKSK